jgi:hypothetical protein
VYRRGRGSSIQEQTVGDNVGKLPWAAGTGYNLQGLSKRGQKPKEERAQRERRMSPYERRRRSNVLSGDGSRLPNGGNTRVGQRGSGHLAAFSVCLGGRLDKTGTQLTRMTALEGAPWQGGAFQWVQGPPGDSLQPEAIGAVMEVTKWLKPSISVSRIGDSASVQAVTRVNAEQASKRTMRRPTR